MPPRQRSMGASEQHPADGDDAVHVACGGLFGLLVGPLEHEKVIAPAEVGRARGRGGALEGEE